MAKVAVVQKIRFPECKPLPGVTELLSTLSRVPGMQVALASSSHRANFHLKTNHMQELFSVFGEDRRVLGDDPRIPKGKGKPAPDIYLLALECINKGLKDGEEKIEPEECLVFEDAVLGVEAGLRAGMQVVWCPHPELLKEYEGRENLVLAGKANEASETEGQEVAAGIEDNILRKERRTGSRAEEEPGRADDDRTVLLKTLEGFPYRRFGIEIGPKL